MQAPGTVHPLTLEPIERPLPPETTDVAAVVAECRAAQRAWAALPAHQRYDQVRALGRNIVEKRNEVAEIIAAETGRTPTEALLNEVISLLPGIEGHISIARQVVPERIPLSMLDHPGKKLVVEPLPRGVIAIIAPWNYPLSNFFKSLFLALLTGNGVILKPSEWTPRTGEWLAARCAESLPPGLVRVAFGDGRVGTELLDAGIDGLVFTGSVATGTKVAAAAAARLIPTSLELGGKDAAIVLADCDLSRTVAGVAKWALTNAGQDCSSIERIYVEDAIADRFVEALTAFVQKLRVPEDLGPLQNERQLQTVEDHVADALAGGAELKCGGARLGRGYAYAPTILDRCRNDLRVIREETFGPVLPIIRVRDAQQAIELANDNPFGLGASVWTSDAARGASVARQLDVGMAWVNNHSITSTMTEAPWSGVKASGTGVAQSRHALPTFVRWRTLLVDTGRDPDPWWMPADASLDALVDAVARRSLGSLGATLSLLGILRRRVQAIRAGVK